MWLDLLRNHQQRHFEASVAVVVAVIVVVVVVEAFSVVTAAVV